jgi:ankyrin repeat protein
MDIWTIYKTLVQACVTGLVSDLLKQGVSQGVEWHSPTADYMYKKDKRAYIEERSGIALFICAHRGNINLVKDLIQNHNANINYQTFYGRTPLMLSVASNKLDVIDFLLKKNANADIEDINGDSAFSIAKFFKNKSSLNKLTQYKWRKRIKLNLKEKNDEKESREIFADLRSPHQMFDSSKKTWLKGDFMQVYMMNLTPAREFSGSRLSAPKSVGLEGNNFLKRKVYHLFINRLIFD